MFYTAEDSKLLVSKCLSLLSNSTCVRPLDHIHQYVITLCRGKNDESALYLQIGPLHLGDVQECTADGWDGLEAGIESVISRSQYVRSGGFAKHKPPIEDRVMRDKV